MKVSTMFSLGVILLVLNTYVHAGGQPSFVRPSSRRSEASDGAVVLKQRKSPLDRKSFKIIPVPKSGPNRRIARKDDQTTEWQIMLPKLQARFSRNMNEVPFKIVRRPERQKSLYLIRRNDRDSSVQRVQSPDGVVAIPVSVSQKTQTSGTIPQINQERVEYANKVDKFDLRPPTIIQNANTGISKDGNADNLSYPRAEDLQDVVYQFKQAPLPPVVVNDYKPYDFGYGIDDGLGSSQFRRESTAGDGVVTGNYGYKDYQGVFRHVNYIADKDGFRAVMRTNEPSVLPVDSADVAVIVDPPPPLVIVPSKKYLSNAMLS